MMASNITEPAVISHDTQVFPFPFSSTLKKKAETPPDAPKLGQLRRHHETLQTDELPGAVHASESNLTTNCPATIRNSEELNGAWKRLQQHQNTFQELHEHLEAVCKEVVFEHDPHSDAASPAPLSWSSSSPFVVHQTSVQGLIGFMNSINCHQNDHLRQAWIHLTEELQGYHLQLNHIVSAHWESLKLKINIENSSFLYDNTTHFNTIEKFKLVAPPVFASLLMALASHTQVSQATQLTKLFRRKVWSGDIWTVITAFDLKPELVKYACCPKCFSLYPPSSKEGSPMYPLYCSFQETTEVSPNKQPKRHQPTNQKSCKQNKGEEKEEDKPKAIQPITPICTYSYQSMKSWVRATLPTFSISSMQDIWNRSLCAHIKDVWHAPAFRTFQGPDKQPFHVAPEGKFWHVGVFFTKTTAHPFGKLVRAVLIILICDTQALKKATDGQNQSIHLEMKDVEGAHKSVRTHNPERQAKELQTGVQAIKTASLTSSLDLRVSKIITKKMYAEALLAWYKANPGAKIRLPCVFPGSVECLEKPWTSSPKNDIILGSQELTKAWTSSPKNDIILGSQELTKVWSDITATTLPSWSPIPWVVHLMEG
ncbi:hypothetical protein PAXINDRAFT_152828 [Paxillus involutus ATCC 200175]|nr:hypothetical protein PAXINDRAFT_152828 [Paxillus involutus ATCC 200175]